MQSIKIYVGNSHGKTGTSSTVHTSVSRSPSPMFKTSHVYETTAGPENGLNVHTKLMESVIKKDGLDAKLHRSYHTLILIIVVNIVFFLFLKFKCIRTRSIKGINKQ